MKRRDFMGGTLLFGLGLNYFPARSISLYSKGFTRAVIHEHILVAKDVCAWPKLALAPSNKILGLIHNQPIHGSVGKSDVELWVGSRDAKSWKKQSVVTASSDDTSFYNHAIGINRHGNIVMLTSGWTRNKMDEANFYPKKRGGAYLINTLSGISRDEGKTWKLNENVEKNDEGINLIPFGTIALGDDGSLRVASFVFRTKVENERVDTCYILKSEDDGESWFIDSIVGNYMQNETDLAYAGNGTWYVIARTLNPNGHNTELFVSKDDAQNWKSLGPVTLAKQHPGDILPCRDGKLVITYGNRIPDQFGIEAIVSYDKGLTWSGPIRLANTSNGDSGYPSSVELEDGSIVTGYYAKGGDLYENYYFGVVKWDLRK